MRSSTRLVRRLALVLATVLVALGAATPVQAASKRETYSEYVLAVMMASASLVARDTGFELTSADIAMVNRGASDPWMFATSSKICKSMSASKTSAARKRTRAAIVDYLSDTSVEELHAIASHPGYSEDVKYFISAMVGSQTVTVILAASNVLCPKQAPHIQPMIDAYTVAVEKKAGS